MDDRPPPEKPDEADEPDKPEEETPEDRFLIALWDRLERALYLSTSAQAMENLGEVATLCDEAADLIRRRLKGER